MKSALLSLILMGHAAVRAQLLVTAPLTAAFPDPAEAVCIRSQNLDGYRLIQIDLELVIIRLI